MAERRVKVLFEAEIQGFKRAMKEASDATQNAKKATEEAGKTADTMMGRMVQSATKNKEEWQAVGTTIAGVGAATVAGVGLAVKTYADFDKAMSGVQAATHESTQNMELLREAAIAAGADTAFSAEEAALGIEELAKAGVSTADVLSGGLDGALALAAAGELEVGAAAEIAASAMTQFGLEGAKIPHIADLLAAGAGKAQGSVHDMGEALNQVGLVANNTGLTIEETTGGLAAFASAGLTGSDAGTSFKSMLQRLTPQSEAAATLMDELGVSAYDSAGQFVGLSEYAGILQTALKDMAPEQRNAAMQTLFGADAVRAASVLYEQGAEGVQEWEEAVTDAGFAAETAALLQDNLAGDLEKLGGSIDTVFLKSGSGANDVLRGMVQGLEDVVDTIGKIPGPVLSTGAMIAGVAGGAALLAGGLITVVPKILETKEAFDVLAPAGGRARGAVAKAGKAAGIAAAGYIALSAAVKLASDATDANRAKTSVEGFTNAISGMADKGAAARASLSGMFEGVTKPGNADAGFTAVNDLGSALERVFNPSFNDTINDFWGSVFPDVTSGSEATRAAFADLDESISGLASSGNAEDAAAAFQEINRQAADAGIPLSELVELFPEYQDVIRATATENGATQLSYEDLVGAMSGTGPAALTAAEGAAELQSGLEEVGIAADGVIENMEDFLELLFATGLAVMSSRDANAEYHDALREVDETIKTINESGGEMGAMLNKSKSDFDLTTEAGKLANDTFQNIAQSGMAEVEAMSKEGLGQDELQAKLRTTHDDLVQAGIDMGLLEDEAGDLAREVLGVPDGVDIDTWMEDTARREADNTAAAVNAIPDGKTVHTKFVRTFETHGIPFPAAPADPGASAWERLGGVATGGRIPGFSDGGQLPTSGPGTDTVDGIVGISAMGTPVARVDAGEWIINRRSSDRYNRTLAAINAGTFPTLPGYAAGGQVATAQPFAGGGPRIDLGGITINGATDVNAVRRAVMDEIQWKFQQNGVRLG